LTVPVRTVRTATWQGRTIMLTWQLDDVSRFYWLVVVQSGDGTCHLMANDVRTRGPIGGRHVSLVYWLMVFWFINQKFMGSTGFEPVTSHYAKVFKHIR